MNKWEAVSGALFVTHYNGRIATIWKFSTTGQRSPTSAASLLTKVLIGSWALISSPSLSKSLKTKRRFEVNSMEQLSQLLAWLSCLHLDQVY